MGLFRSFGERTAFSCLLAILLVDACSACSFLSAIGPQDVSAAKFVTSEAMRLSRLSGNDSFSTQQIDASGNGFQMGGIDARANAAQVVYVEANWNSSVMDLPRYPVGVVFTPSLTDALRSAPVSMNFIHQTDPNPARTQFGPVGRYRSIFVDIFEERRKRFKIKVGHVISFTDPCLSLRDGCDRLAGKSHYTVGGR